MEDYIFKTLTISLASLLLYITIKCLHDFWWRPSRIEKLLRQQGIRGTSYKFLNGDISEMMQSTKEAASKPMSLNHQTVPRVMPFFHQLVQQYGKISLFWSGRTPCLLVGDAELVRFILANKNDHFIKPPRNPLAHLFHMGITTLEGEKWSKRRKLVAPAFLLEKLKEMVPIMIASCSSLIEGWQELAKGEGSCEVDVFPDLNALTSDVIARTAFGSSFQEGKMIFELQKQQAELMREAFWITYIPGLRFIPTEKNKMRYQMYNQINGILGEMVEKREQIMRTGALENHDLLSLLLLKCKESSKTSLTIGDVIEECKLFYFAGQETTTTLLTWTMVVLSMHPEWQEKARKEVLEICGKRTPDLETINRFKILTMILYEVLRLYTPVAYIQRYTLCETKIGSITIPAGMRIELPFLLLHSDKQYWDNPEKFNPDRFSEGVSKASHDQIAFYPFGWGPRICLGQNFALIEAKLAISMILQHFTFQLSPSYAHAPINTLSLTPQHGAPIIIRSI